MYRARDSRLDSTVKILPEAVAADEERLRRSEQEPRLPPSTPNVPFIYDSGTLC